MKIGIAGAIQASLASSLMMFPMSNFAQGQSATYRERPALAGIGISSASLMQATHRGALDCQSYLGASPVTTPADVVVSVLSKFPSSKSEFETTASFEARQFQAGPAPTFVVPIKVTRSLIRYDADAGLMRIHKYAVAVTRPTYRSSYVESGPDALNVDILLTDVEKKRGSYRAANAFGATVLVDRIDRTQISVWERRSERGELGSVFPREGPENYIAEFAVAPSDARVLKEGMKAAIVFTPRVPYLAEHERLDTPKLGYPERVRTHNTMIYADIQCGLFTDQQGRVVKAVAAL